MIGLTGGDFGYALTAMRQGIRVRRKGWSASEWITISKDGMAIVDEDGKPTVFRDSAPLLATDWIVVGEASQ